MSALTTSYSYNPLYNKPTSVTDPRGLVTAMQYDPATGNLLSTEVDFGGSGHFNATSRFTYNGYGQVLTASDPLGTVTSTVYDGQGNPLSVTRAGGGLSQAAHFTYSAPGDVATATDPNGNVTKNTYDADRRLTRVTAPPAPLALVTSYTYDPDGLVLQVQESASGAVLSTVAAPTPRRGRSRPRPMPTAM